MSKRVAFVVQRCGLEVNGGAELHCRLVAEHLARRMPVEVLTTCALDYLSWANHYPEGEERLGDLRIRRFPVAQRREMRSFNELSTALQRRMNELTLVEQEEWMRRQGPWSPDLFEHLEDHRDEYDAFVFFTYLYASTYFGLPLVADKAILVPTAHDEWPIYFGMFDRLFEMPRAFIFNTPEEVAFLRRRFSGAALNGPILGAGVDVPASLDPAGFRERHSVRGPFILYVGRIDANKGVPDLIAHYGAYREWSRDAATELVLIGKQAMDLPAAPGLRPLGFVSDAEKWNAMAACTAVVMPSPYESLSIVCLEAWSLGKPVLVNAKSEVLVGQARRSEGGLWYRDVEEFCATLQTLVAGASLRAALGEQGRRFVERNYRWSGIVDGYSDVISTLG